MLNKLKQKSEFSRNVLTLMTGTTIAQAIPIAISPLLTRLYSPEDFGQYAMILSIIMILSPVVSLRYEQAIMLPKDNNLATALFQGSFYILFIMIVLILIILVLFKEILSINNLMIFFVITGVFIIGVINIIFSYLNREKKYKQLTNVLVYTSLYNSVINIILGFLAHSYIALYISLLLSKLFSIKDLLPIFLKQMKIKIKYKTIINSLKDYNDMFKYSVPEIFIGNINRYAIFFFLTYTFEASLAGGYFLIQKILGTPISVFSSSFSKVFFQKFTVSRNRKELLYTTWIKLSVISIPLTFLLYIYVPDIVVFLFGDKWKFSAEIAQVLLPFFAINFIFSSTSTSHITLRMQHLSLFFAIVSFFIRIVIYIYGYYSKNFIETITLLVVYDILQVILMNFLVFKTLKEN